MAKEKKITIKYYLNKSLKAKEIDGKTHFPLYMQLVYNRQNIRLKLKIDNKKTIYLDEEMGLSDSKFIQLRDKLNKKEFRMRQIIRYEVQNRVNFSLANFSKRLAIYEWNLLRTIKAGLSWSMELIAQKEFNYNKFMDFKKKDFLSRFDIISQILIKNKAKKTDRNVRLILLSGFMYNQLTDVFSAEDLSEIKIYDWVLGGSREKMPDMISRSTENIFAMKEEIPEKVLNLIKEQRKEIKNAAVEFIDLVIESTFNQLPERLKSNKNLD